MKSTASSVSKALLLLALLAGSQAQPLEDAREQRQMKSGVADLKMLDASSGNVTPAANLGMPLGMSMGMSMGMPSLQMPFNQQALNMADMQLTRYPNYPGFIYGNGYAPGQQLSGLPAAYPNYNQAAGLPGASSGFTFGYPNTAANGFNGYPNGQLSQGYPNAQLSQGYMPQQQPSVDNFASLNNIINMANAQGLGAGPVPTGIYGPAPQLGAGQQQLSPFGSFGGGYLERMPMNLYAPSF